MTHFHQDRAEYNAKQNMHIKRNLIFLLRCLLRARLAREVAAVGTAAASRAIVEDGLILCRSGIGSDGGATPPDARFSARLPFDFSAEKGAKSALFAVADARSGR